MESIYERAQLEELRRLAQENERLRERIAELEADDRRLPPADAAPIVKILSVFPDLSIDEASKLCPGYESKRPRRQHPRRVRTEDLADEEIERRMAVVAARQKEQRRRNS